MRVHYEVIKIKPDEKNVTVKNPETGEIFAEDCEKLLLSTGAKPVYVICQSGLRSYILSRILS